DGCLDAVRRDRARGIGKTGNKRPLRGVVVDALRDPGSAWVPAQVHVELAARRSHAGLLPHPALEVASVTADGVDVVPSAPDDAVERMRQVGRAVDGRPDPL